MDVASDVSTTLPCVREVQPQGRADAHEDLGECFKRTPRYQAGNGPLCEWRTGHRRRKKLLLREGISARKSLRD